MPLASCVRCNKMFTKIHSSVCRACQPVEDEDFEKIHAIISQDESLNVKQVAEAAQVDVAVVSRMVEEGVVAQVSLGDRSAVCGQCGGVAISMSKKLCQACLEKLNMRVTRAQSKIKLSQRPDVEVGKQVSAREVFEEKRK